jgi:hypothetical protein
LNLAEKPLSPEDGGQFGSQDLDRDTTVVLEVAGQVDGRHATLTDLALDRVTIGQRRFETVEAGSHRQNRLVRVSARNLEARKLIIRKGVGNRAP